MINKWDYEICIYVYLCSFYFPLHFIHSQRLTLQSLIHGNFSTASYISQFTNIPITQVNNKLISTQYITVANEQCVDIKRAILI